jgi:hypothetical protein
MARRPNTRMEDRGWRMEVNTKTRMEDGGWRMAAAQDDRDPFNFALAVH